MNKSNKLRGLRPANSSSNLVDSKGTQGNPLDSLNTMGTTTGRISSSSSTVSASPSRAHQPSVSVQSERAPETSAVYRGQGKLTVTDLKGRVIAEGPGKLQVDSIYEGPRQMGKAAARAGALNWAQGRDPKVSAYPLDSYAALEERIKTTDGYTAGYAMSNPHHVMLSKAAIKPRTADEMERTGNSWRHFLNGKEISEADARRIHGPSTANWPFPVSVDGATRTVIKVPKTKVHMIAAAAKQATQK